MSFDLKKSFTLVEMSIVLSVIALLSGIVISGASIINSAKAIKIVKEISTYREAIDSFYKTFDSYPGDYGNAQYNLAPKGYSTKTWSEISREKNILDITPHDGNQDGVVSNEILNDSGSNYSEVFGVWSHLSAYNLIDKKYSNVCKTSSGASVNSGCAKGDYNLPLISLGNNSSSVYIFYHPDYEKSNESNLLGQIIKNEEMKDLGVMLMVDISHKYTYDGLSLDQNYILGGGGAVKSSLMFIVDKKIDDGLPLEGNVLGINGSNEDKKINISQKDGQCNTYKGRNSVVPEDTKKILYSNDINKDCIGVILFR